MSNGDRIMVSRDELANLREQKSKAESLNRVIKEENRHLHDRCSAYMLAIDKYRDGLAGAKSLHVLLCCVAGMLACAVVYLALK